jgi:hypothetical protein
MNVTDTTTSRSAFARSAVASGGSPAQSRAQALVLDWDYDARWKKLIGPLFQEIQRRDFNKRHRLLLEWWVKSTLGRGRCWQYGPSLEFLAGPLGFNRSAVYEILHGYRSESGAPVAGLAELGIVRVRECADGGWLLVMVPDASRWGVVAAYSPEMHAMKLADSDTVCAQFAAQLESGTIAEWFPDLSVMMDSVQLDDALTVAGGSSKAASETTTTSGGRGVEMDARRVRPERERASVTPCRSNIRNAEMPANARCVPIIGTPTVKQLNSIKQITVQQLNSIGNDDSNRLLALLREQFVRVHGEQWATKEMQNSGAAWRMVARAWPDEFEIQVGEMRNFINSGGKIRCAWAYFQNYFKAAVGCSTWSDVCIKSKESFLTT